MASKNTAHSLVGELFFAVVGVGAFTIVANGSQKAGKILLTLMLGFLLVWFVIHGQNFNIALQKLRSLGLKG